MQSLKTMTRGGPTTSSVNYVALANILNDRMKNRRGGANQRLAIMLGMLTTDQKIKANIPEKDRSLFSQEKYKFMLEAPFEVSNKCCNVMKKEPAHRFAKQTGKMPITGQMASESRLRQQVWMKHGCNGFNNTHPISNPMSFWQEQDCLQYIYEKKLPIASVYGDVVIDYAAMGQTEGQLSFFSEQPIYKTTGCWRTGCFACMYGAHKDKPCDCNMTKTIEFSNPKLVDWELRGGHFREDGMWEPKGGLGYWFVLEYCRIHGGLNYYIPNREYYLKKYMTEETKKCLYG